MLLVVWLSGCYVFVLGYFCFWFGLGVFGVGFFWVFGSILVLGGVFIWVGELDL